MTKERDERILAQLQLCLPTDEYHDDDDMDTAESAYDAALRRAADFIRGRITNYADPKPF